MTDELKNHTFDRSGFVELRGSLDPCADLIALLERAREGLKEIQYQYRPITTPNDREPAFVIASETLAAISESTGKRAIMNDKATGEKQ